MYWVSVHFACLLNYCHYCPQCTALKPAKVSISRKILQKSERKPVKMYIYENQ